LARKTTTIERYCSICGSPAPKDAPTFWGNNAAPVNDGECCDWCNSAIVVMRRINDSTRAELAKLARAADAAAE
jgi:hypothetical protein